MTLLITYFVAVLCQVTAALLIHKSKHGHVTTLVKVFLLPEMNIKEPLVIMKP